MTDDDLVTPDDVASLNRAAIERSAAIARIAGSVLVGVGALGAATWVWIEYRTQDRAGNTGFAIGAEASSLDLSFEQRIDLFAGSFGVFVMAALVIGVGLLIRLIADVAQARAGSSITGFEVGDSLDGL